MKGEAFAMAHSSSDDTLALPKETFVNVMGYAVDNMYESAFESVQEDERVKSCASRTTNVAQLKDAFASEIISVFKKGRPTILGWRLVSHLWKSAVEETIWKREILKLNFTPEDALNGEPINEMFKSLAHIIRGLEFTGWGEGEFPNVGNTISTYQLNKITAIRIEPNVTPLLFEFMDFCPHITKISIIGNLGPKDLAPITLPRLFERDLTKLRYLNLSGNNLKGHIIPFLINTGIKFVNLEELHLANNNITEMSMGYFDYVKDDPLPSLKVLNLSYNEWPRSNSNIEKTIEKIFTLCPKLTTVNVENCALDKDELIEIAKRTDKIIQF